MLELTFSSKLDWGSHITSILRTVTKKIGVFIRSIKFLSPEFAINLPYGYACNAVVMCGVLLLIATWNCWISYKNQYAGLLILHLLPLLNPWLILEMSPA